MAGNQWSVVYHLAQLSIWIFVVVNFFLLTAMDDLTLRDLSRAQPYAPEQ
ncbi:MAG: hypothetical protein H6669_13570 [Ardenticatenaceae bacterium]|nr:hypothetical protein [Ardenticatenaceae bacterium]